MGLFLAALALVLIAQACRLAERRAYRKGFRDGLRAAARQVAAAERHAGVAGGWANFPRR